MIVPMWVPFAFLAAVCAVCPLPGWSRRTDWLGVTAWVVFPFTCWAFFVWWLL